MIETLEQLRELYGFASGRAKDKQLSALEQHSKHFLRCSPLVILSTIGADGKLDCSPRGGEPGFVKVIDDQTLIIPDFRGNNRLESLCNIVQCPQVGCLFLIPGVDETLRLNGRATLSTDPIYLGVFAGAKNPPKCVIKIEVVELFMHCAKAFMRSELWSESAKIDRESFPTMGQILNDHLGDVSMPESRQAMLERYKDQM
jgi:uncharacterized protein